MRDPVGGEMSDAFQCPKCQCMVAPGSAACGLCGYAFQPERPASRQSEDVEGVAIRLPLKRPHGGSLLTWGMLLLVASVLLVVAALMTETTRFGSLNPDAVARQWLLTLAAGGLFQLGLFLALAGAVVRAIWFLPGDDTKPAP